MEFTSEDPRIRFYDEGSGVYQLDVRELLMSGGEPYQAIMACVRQLSGSTELHLHAIFEPAPLIRKLERRGYRLTTEHAGVDHWIVRIQAP